MVAVDFLQFKKNRVRQPMQYAWCAATTKNFLGTSVDKISKKEIDDLDISSLCDDIMSEMSESQEGTRLTLYLSSMLASGTVSLFKQQTDSLMDDCQKLMIDLIGGSDDFTQKKKKKVKGKKTVEPPPEEPIDISIQSIPNIDIEKVLKKRDATDRHLITEMDFIEIPEIPESFGFNPNERELTEEELYKRMMGYDPQPVFPDNIPQENGFHMNDEPMIQEPNVHSPENRVTPQGSPRPGPAGMETPRPRKHPTRSAKSAPRSSSPSESAKTAFSPQKKRPRTSYAPDQEADIAGDVMMVPTEPKQEAAFPHDVPREPEASASPVFDFRKRRRLNITSPLLRKRLADKGRAIADQLGEPQLGDQLHHESAPADLPGVDAQVDLPNVSVIDEPPPAATPPEINASPQSSNQSFHGFGQMPPPAPIPPEGNLEVNQSPRSSNQSFHGFNQTSPPAEANQNEIIPTPRRGRVIPEPSPRASDRSPSVLDSFEDEPRKKYIRKGRKIFADRSKQIDIEARPINFMTHTRLEVLYPPALRLESALSLLGKPALLKNKKFFPENRSWHDTLFQLYHELTPAQPKKKEPAQKRNGKRARDSSEQRDEQNQGDRDEIPPEQREPSLPQNDDQQVVEPIQQRSSLVPDDNQMEIGAAEPNVQLPPVDEPPVDVPPVDVPLPDVQTENLQEQIGNEVVHGAMPEFEQPPVVEPVFEKPRVPEVNDRVEAVMSPPKRFKSRDDRELPGGDPRSNRNLTVEELFEIIKSCWDKVKKRDIKRSRCVRVGFHKVVKFDRYTGVEAARYLQYCFILENSKKLYLQQAVPYDTAYLVKW